MNAPSDLASLSSVGAQLDELATRITEMAERYGETPDSLVAAELFAAERGLMVARRSVERAASALGDIA